MSHLSKERPQFADRYAEKDQERRVRRFGEIIKEKSIPWEQELLGRIVAQREARGEKPLVPVYEPSTSSAGTFGIIDTSGNLAFIFERKGRMGIQRTITDMREIGETAPISSRMISSDAVESLIWFMVLPSPEKSPLSEATLELNPHEIELIRARGIKPSKNIPLAS